jgi:lysozyme
MRFVMACIVFLGLVSHPGYSASNSLISLSHYDEVNPDFSRMRSSGIEGIIHEATYPSFDRDSKYAYRQSGASKAGLLWGAYHFGNGSDGGRQADHFLDVVGSSLESSSAKSGVLLVLDAEQNTHYPGGTMGVPQAISFIRRVHARTGIYPGFYSNENWVKRMFNDPRMDASARETLGKCWLWIANYSCQPVYTGSFKKWSLWQYTGDGKCRLPRASYPIHAANMTRVERTIFNGDRGALREFWDSHAWRR